MDVKIGDWVVTPRTGKPVEIQALWLNALYTASHFADTLVKLAFGLGPAAERSPGAPEYEIAILARRLRATLSA